MVAKGARGIGGTPGPEGRNPGHSPRPFGAAGELANPKGDAEQWQSGSEYETLRHHLEAAYAATEAALVEEESEAGPKRCRRSPRSHAAIIPSEALHSVADCSLPPEAMPIL